MTINNSLKSLVIGLLAFIVTTAPAFAQLTSSPRKTIALPNGAKPIPKGPFTPDWESIRKHYKTPEWFVDAKFGIMLHWGLYAVPAKQSEWYPMHMYNNDEIMKWHTEKFGAPDKFGYKDFIPMFTAAKFDPDQWAELFRRAGARYVVPTAEHHDGFALYDSALTKWDAKDMGPKRDLIGDLAASVRKAGLKFGVSNHRMEHWSFMFPKNPNVKTDLFDPAYADFYGPPQPPVAGKDHMSGKGVPQSQEFLEEWLMRTQEMIEKYRPDMLWFDNGVNDRGLDPVKLRLAAYYYNRAAEWKKPVSLSTKSDAFLHGTIMDFERQSRAPKEITSFPWQVDDPILYRFGYTEGSPIASVGTVVSRLVENVSKNGALLLNLSPKADGTIPDDQQKLLLEIGAWMDANGDAIYGTRPWKQFGEGEGASTLRFTVKKGALNVFVMRPASGEVLVRALAGSSVMIRTAELVGGKTKIKFTQTADGVRLTLPAGLNEKLPVAIRLTGATKF